MVIDLNGPPCQGNCPNHGCVESLASGTALAREALRIARERPESGLGAGAGRRAASSPARWSPSSPTTAIEAAIEAIELIGTRLGVAIASFVNIFNPEVVVIGGGVIGAGELLLGRRPGPRSPRGRCRPRGTWSRSCRRRSASRRG